MIAFNTKEGRKSFNLRPSWRRERDLRLERRARLTAHRAVKSAGRDPRDLRPIGRVEGQPIELVSPQIPFLPYEYENAADKRPPHFHGAEKGI